MSAALIFVAGTGTGVGKTHVTAALLQAFSRRGLRALAAKPIETGVSNLGEMCSDIARLSEAAGAELGFCNIYALRKPASPHLAARLEGVAIDPERVRTAVLSAAGRADGLFLIEGAGGLRVPLRPGYEMIDLARDLGAPLLLVGRSGLGTLNETLLSLEAIARRGLPLLGTILSEVQPGDDAEIRQDNLAYLSAHAPGGVLGLLPHGAARIEDHVDLDGLLQRLQGEHPTGGGPRGA
jgi:dethiobiotin synthetase